MARQGPADLADRVLKHFSTKPPGFPSRGVLVGLFETMYFASLETEEGRPIVFHIAYIDPKNPDPDPPKRIVADRWSYVPLQRLRLNIQTAVKLAQATDPRTSSLAVFHGGQSDLYVNGLVDQGNRYHDFVHYESESGPGRPGMFQASIVGVGHLVVYDEYDTVGELKVDRLLPLPVDVFRSGPVLEALSLGLDDYVDTVREGVGDEIFTERPHWPESLAGDWTSALCRILLRIQRYRHGGALLITPDQHLRDLNPKYPLSYGRLRTALVRRGVETIINTSAADAISTLLDADQPALPMDLYLEEAVTDNNINDVRSEIDGALWFISLLSRVDGLVLMNPYLEILAFGVEITQNMEPARLWVTQSPTAAKSRKRKGDYSHYGTRHRSMMRYCAHVPGSVGFVISQDGDARALTTSEGDLVMWENIKLRLQDFGRG
jgi:hypothetical protein